MLQPHNVTVETTDATPFYPGHPGYYAECDICGHLMNAHDDPRFAHRRANDHRAAFPDIERDADGSLIILVDRDGINQL